MNQPGRKFRLSLQAWRVVRKSLNSLMFIVVPGCLLFASCGLKDPVTEVKSAKKEYKVVRPTIVFEILHDAPGCLIVDLREPKEFNGPQGHLAHSQNIPLAQLEERLPELKSYKDSTFIVLCRQEGDCARRGMELLTGSGFRYAILMEDGIEGWIKTGYGTIGASEE